MMFYFLRVHVWGKRQQSEKVQGEKSDLLSFFLYENISCHLSTAFAYPTPRPTSSRMFVQKDKKKQEVKVYDMKSVHPPRPGSCGELTAKQTLPLYENADPKLPNAVTHQALQSAFGPSSSLILFKQSTKPSYGSSSGLRPITSSASPANTTPSGRTVLSD